MNLDWAHFTPWMSLSGGIIFGHCLGHIHLGQRANPGNQRHFGWSYATKGRGHLLAHRLLIGFVHGAHGVSCRGSGRIHHNATHRRN